MPNKNIRPLAGVPLLAYTIAAAKQADIFECIFVSTEDQDIADVALMHGADDIPRPDEFARDDSPDIEWVRHALEYLAEKGLQPDAFGLLRVTSPFRSAESIRRAWALFQSKPHMDSLRAVAPAPVHPGKMWIPGPSSSSSMVPLLVQPTDQPWHSSPTQTLPPVLAQTAALEMAWTRTVKETGTIAGRRVLPFELPGHESVDINTEADWEFAEWLAETGRASLPEVWV